MAGFRIQDATLNINTGLPNAANTVNTNALDISANAPFPVTQDFTVQFGVTQGAGANSKNVNVVLQHTGNVNGNIDSANWANIPQLEPLVCSGNAANINANNINVQLPPDVKEFIRAQATGEANGGTGAGGVVYVQLLF